LELVNKLAPVIGDVTNKKGAGKVRKTMAQNSDAFAAERGEHELARVAVALLHHRAHRFSKLLLPKGLFLCRPKMQTPLVVHSGMFHFKIQAQVVLTTAGNQIREPWDLLSRKCSVEMRASVKRLNFLQSLVPQIARAVCAPVQGIIVVDYGHLILCEHDIHFYPRAAERACFSYRRQRIFRC
jgi:hypothetical protein